jgi:hypothetical protein
MEHPILPQQVHPDVTSVAMGPVCHFFPGDARAHFIRCANAVNRRRI